MKKPNRIGLSLFDEELLSLINASAKIFPITQDMINNNLNPDNYEYGRIDNSIYRWTGSAWKYVIADDTNIEWLEIKNKPVQYPSTSHNHLESEITDLDKYTKSEVDIKLAIKSNTDHIHDEKYYDKSIIDNKFATHIHDERYYVKGDIDSLLTNKSDTTHLHDGRYYLKSEVDNKLSNKVDNTTLKNHTDNTNIHVATTDKTVWNAKSKIDIGTVQPLDNSIWFAEIL